MTKMKYTREMLERLKKMGECGMTVPEIASATGIPLKNLRYLFYDSRHNMPYKRIHTKATEDGMCALIEARVRKNLSREEVEEATGITVTTIYNWEHGRMPKLVARAVKLARLYGVSVEELVGDPDV